MTRDRWAAHANACAAGAPRATPVADRFHLVGNIRERVERLSEPHGSSLDAALEPPPVVLDSCVETRSITVISIASTPDAVMSATTSDDPNRHAARATQAPPLLSQRQYRRQDRFEEVRRLRREGQSIRRIARELRISSRAVPRYARSSQRPNWNPGAPRATRLDRFESAVDAFIREGGRTATVLHRGLAGPGCQSSYRAVLRFRGHRLQAAGIAPVGSSRGPPRPRRPPARALSFEFVRREENRSEQEIKRMTTMNAIPGSCAPLTLANRRGNGVCQGDAVRRVHR
ncbi:transposase : ISL3 family transposase OS=Planctomyces maris DSM 8797 GN=PM8797T_28359 PE=4 SV=1 [Gemmata massiliana]|uniref:Transposase: ISL3 family transposase n=1 Tax=Gemmata massiliana TaxID=1210884 RepID=A0A6P2CWY4_9BACT|nr:hypothetical protein [Gemmata massiliana]VTR92655.1 transposase : ISL3 family transposase OS=Planctomyces maris DSM 8797 GN=PM8797T_28359 PE=4 SV=1 [Gemmata massiliana]